jgi:RNA polymerase sigma-70 factor (ECF subfamily)
MSVGSREVDSSVVEPRTRQQAFTEYVVPEIEVLYRVARSLTAQAADAEDLVQDTLIRAYRSIDRFDGQYPRAWLLTILRNTEHNRHRRRRPHLLDDPDELADLAVAATTPGPEDLLIDAMFDATVEQAFQALPEKYRQAIALVDIHGLSYAQAAALLDVPVGTVMSRLHRARDRIRRQLRAEGVAATPAAKGDRAR